MDDNYDHIYEKHEDIYKKLKTSGHEGWGGANFSNRIDGWEKNIDKINSFISNKKGKLLEMGCGTGDVARLFDKLGFTVEGIDISETAIEWAKSKSADYGDDIDFQAINVCHDSFWLDKRYQVIVDGNCMHCILGEDRKRLLKNIYESLEDEGYLIVSSLINKDEDGLSVCDTSINSEIAPVERHLASKLTLEEELRSFEFKILDSWVSHSKNHNHYFAILSK